MLGVPIDDAKISLQFGRYGIEVLIDSASGDGSESWVVNSRGLERYVTEILTNCKQCMFTETATQQDASCIIEKSVVDVAFEARSQVKAPLARCAEPSSPPVKLLPTRVM